MNPSRGGAPRIAAIISLALFHASVLLLLFSNNSGVLAAAVTLMVAAGTITSLFNIRFPRAVPISLGISVILAGNRPFSIPISFALLALLWLVIAVLHLRTRRRHPSPGSLSPANPGW